MARRNNEYGKHIANYHWTVGEGAIVNRCLEIFEVKTGVKGLLWNAGRHGWRDEQYVPIHRSMIWPRMNSETTEDVVRRMCKYYEVPSDARVENPPLHNYGTIK